MNASSLPLTMTAIAIKQPGESARLEPIALPVPHPGAHEILLRVAAAGINRPDSMQRRGLYPPPPGAPATPGLEVSGTVVACGAGVIRHRLGDAVTALVVGGGYAEYCLAHETHALPIPAGFDLVQAAAIPETYFTVWANLFMPVRPSRGQTMLIHGGAGGIGTTAVQLCHAFGADVITTVGSAAKASRCRELGASAAIIYCEEDFVAATKVHTSGRGADVILDMVGGDYLARNMAAAAFGGRIVQIAFQRGSRCELDLMPVMRKRLTLTGSTLRPRSIAEKAQIANELYTHVWPLFAAKRLGPILDRSFPLTEAAAAHDYFDAGEHIGKIVLINTNNDC